MPCSESWNQASVWDGVESARPPEGAGSFRAGLKTGVRTYYYAGGGSLTIDYGAR